MKSLLALLVLFLMSLSAQAQVAETRCGDLEREVEAQDIECLVKELIPRSFPELQSAWDSGRIHFEKLTSQTVFVNGRLISGYTLEPSSRHYAIQVNPAMTRTFLPVLPRPSLQAVQGILAHELVHLVQYETSSAAGLATYLRYSMVGTAAYEHTVDERAFELGYATGIALFRVWASERLGDSEDARYKSWFYTPSEIHDWIMQNELARPRH